MLNTTRSPSHRLTITIPLLLLGLAACGHPPVHMGGLTPPPAIHVTGHGEVRVSPDIARTEVGVEARAATAGAAAAQVNQQMTTVIAALTQAGVAKEDLQTSQMSIYFERTREPHPPRPLPGPEIEGQATAVNAVEKPAGVYRASNSVAVIVRDLDTLPAVLAAATEAGVNQMHGITFDVEDRAPHLAEARARAVQAAQDDAAQLAGLSGVKLGAVLRIMDGSAPSPGGPMPMMAMRAERAMDVPPVEHGQLTISHDVTLIYSLDP